MDKKDQPNNTEALMQYDSKKQIHVPYCFGCSPDNPHGLKINFTIKDDIVLGEFTPHTYHMGPPDAVHGGIIATLIDESMSFFGRGVLKEDVRTMRVEIVYRNQAPIGERLLVEARLQEEKSRMLIITAQVYTEKHAIAEARGTLYKVKKKQMPTPNSQEKK
jgi:acyl-coenzyme A thioesterase PaaI-like protein